MEKLYRHYLHSTGICTDSRKVEKGCLFFALRGERFDGNRYALQALEAGASFAVVDDSSLPQDERLIRVKDSLWAMQQLARHHRRQFDIPVLAVTGTNGKTTTKELCAAVLSKFYRLHYTRGNFNNHIGLPLTILSMPRDTEFLLLEMGANHAGEIEALCRIAEPDFGLITNVGMAHLEGFGSFEGVKQTKSELYRFLAERDGLAFVNLDEPHLQELLPAGLKTFTYSSKKPGADVFVRCIEAHGSLRLAFEEQGQWHEVEMALSGEYNFRNAMTAVAVGLFFSRRSAVATEKAAENITRALEGYRPRMNRSQWVEREGRFYFLDAYNANPVSMRLALEDFAKAKGAFKVAVLGEMLELGVYSEQAHEALLAQALRLPLDRIVCVGEGFAKAAKAAGLPWFAHAGEVKAWLQQQSLPPQSRIFLKGSRKVALEGVL
ncbi:MAG TPA: UDP-N-acetylmuramoyl-tripeptide--D-alanyl-D-alanine ligase [Phaeodactylibacter sp.]|nr:UDP-N-acetylmuramoyl-tripeptide--D-alanyl-D-alanine ligase [Phaeodactylibacter sp.]